MKKFKYAIVVALIAGGNSVILAAPPPPPTGGPVCWPPPCIPADNGVIFLIAAGALLGAKKILDLRRKSSTI
jgi:hypothetical protein